MIDILSEEMSKVKRFQDSTYGHSNLGSLAWQFANDLSRDADNFRKDIDLMTKKVYILDGEPVSGKTHFRKRTEHFFARWVDNLVIGSQKDPVPIKNIKIRSVSWERDGEDRAIDKRLIQPDSSRGIFTPQELRYANMELEEAMKEAINESHIIILEVPGITAYRELLPDSNGVAYRWRGRQLGAQMLYKLCQHAEAFEQLPGYEVYMAGLIGGMDLRRSVLNGVGSQRLDSDYLTTMLAMARDNQERAILRNVFGPTPDSDGARRDAVRLIEAQVNGIIFKQWDEGRLADVGLPREDYTANMFKRLMEDNPLFRIRSLGRHIEAMFKRDFNLSSDKVFIGYNNPTVGEIQARSR